MRLFLFFALALFSVSSKSQNSPFDRGYMTGYQEGYCYQRSNCIPPLPPLPPMANVNESTSNYTDGYNRGFLDGRDRFGKDSAAVGTSQHIRMNNEYVKTTYRSAVTPEFLSLYSKALEAKKRQQEQLRENAQIDYENMLFIKQAAMNAILNIYQGVKNKGTRVADGWHRVHVVNRIDFAENHYVLVNNNNIIEYYTDLYMWDDKSSEMRILAGGNIDTGKTIIQISPTGERGYDSQFLEVYFIDYLKNSSSRSEPPKPTGKISFWTDIQNTGPITVTLGESTGEITQVFHKNTFPTCGQKGMLTIEGVPGSYTYSASNKKRTWQGSATIRSGQCSSMKLTK